MALPPGPPLPGVVQLLGYTYWTLPFFEWCARRYGDPFTIHLPGTGDFVMIGSPQLIKQVFTADSEQLHAGKTNTALEPILGRNSVGLLDGKAHMRQRRLLLPPLHGERMHIYARLMAELAAAQINRMPVGSRFSIQPHMKALTLQVILRVVFGLDAGAQMDHLVPLVYDFMKPLPSALVFIPPQYQQYADLPFSPYRTFVRSREQVNRALRQIIATRRANPDPARTDILSLLLEARDEEGQPLSDDELRDELVTMMFAGHETTATALAWAFAFILHHSDKQERLRAELESARRPDGTIDLAALTSVEYLDAVIRESMRLRPVVPDVMRRVEQPFNLAGYDIPVGTLLTPNVYLAHRKPESWPEPERFLPERFLGRKVDPYSWFPFGGGIRRCLGMAFALTEMKIVIGLTLLSVRMRLATAQPFKITRHNVILAPAEGTPVVIESRSPARLMTAETHD